MRGIRWLLITAFVIAGCGVKGAPRPPRPPPQPLPAVETAPAQSAEEGETPP